MKYFTKVAELNSFSYASKALFISQSTISQQIRQLENELGATLLVRNSRKVVLSDFGEMFFPQAQKLILDAEISLKRIQDVKSLKTGHITVGVTFSFFPILKETIRSFMKQYPGINLDVYCSSMEHIMERLERNELDIALSYNPLQKYEGIDSHVLFTTNLSVIVARSNPLAREDSIRISELEKCHLALPAKGLQARDTFESLINGQNFKFNVRLEVNDLHVLLDMVTNSQLATILASQTIRQMPELASIPLDHPGSEMIGSFHLAKGNYCKVATKEFLHLLMDNNSLNKNIIDSL